MAEKDPRLARIRWACRRGMLELDVLLQPFFDNCFAQLSAEQQQGFERLLQCDDPDLFNWFMNNKPCTDEQLAQMVRTIAQYNQSTLQQG